MGGDSTPTLVTYRMYQDIISVISQSMFDSRIELDCYLGLELPLKIYAIQIKISDERF